MVDAVDLGSAGLWLWGFESPSPHHAPLLKRKFKMAQSLGPNHMILKPTEFVSIDLVCVSKKRKQKIGSWGKAISSAMVGVTDPDITPGQIHKMIENYLRPF